MTEFLPIQNILPQISKGSTQVSSENSVAPGIFSEALGKQNSQTITNAAELNLVNSLIAAQTTGSSETAQRAKELLAFLAHTGGHGMPGLTNDFQNQESLELKPQEDTEVPQQALDILALAPLLAQGTPPTTDSSIPQGGGRLPEGTVPGPVASSSSSMDAISPELRERVRELSRLISEMTAHQVRKPHSAFSPLQAGTSQVNLEADFESIRKTTELKEQPAIQEIAKIIEARTGEKLGSVVDLIAHTILETSSDSETVKLNNLLEKAALEIDFKNGTLRDRSVREPMMGALSSAILSTDLSADLLGEVSKRLQAQGELKPEDMASVQKWIHEMKSSEQTPAGVFDRQLITNALSLEKETNSLRDETQSPVEGAPEILTPIHLNRHESNHMKVATPIPMELEGARGLQRMAIENRDSLITSVHSLAREGGGEMTVNLRPPELGHVRVHVVQTGNGIALNVQAERSDTLGKIQHELPQILRSLESQGIHITKVEVNSITPGSPLIADSNSPYQPKEPSSNQSNAYQDERQKEFIRQQEQNRHSREDREKFFDLLDMVA